jgi:hypothetical protein
MEKLDRHTTLTLINWCRQFYSEVGLCTYCQSGTQPFWLAISIKARIGEWVQKKGQQKMKNAFSETTSMKVFGFSDFRNHSVFPNHSHFMNFPYSKTKSSTEDGKITRKSIRGTNGKNDVL